MTQTYGAVQLDPPHMDESRGRDIMEQPEPKTFTFGNSTVIIHSRLAHMNKKEQKDFFKSEKEKGNPILKEIDRQILDCQMG